MARRILQAEAAGLAGERGTAAQLGAPREAMRRRLMGGERVEKRFLVRRQVAQEIWKIVLDQVYNIGLVGLAPGSYGVRVVKNNVGNVPGRPCQLREARIPCGAHPTTFFFKS